MKLSHHIKFIAQGILAGLALAFLIVLIKPELLPHEGTGPTAQQPPAMAHTAGPSSYADAVMRAAPAVVNINTAKLVDVQPLPFFGRPDGRGGMIRPDQRVERSLGSGVILSAEGHILTNYHVIRGADAIAVSLRDGRMARATLVGADPDTDIAVLKIALKKLPVITLGDSSSLRIGDVVLAIGNPFGVGQTVTQGIVSATGRSRLGINTFENFIQTDAAINPGNSGGALIDAHGRLVGINTAIFSKSGGSHGIGFAIPIRLARGVMNEILKYGRPQRGWLGVEAHVMNPYIAQRLNIEMVPGVIITGILRNGPAHKAGLLPGDIITHINGNKVTDGRDALALISAHKPGSQITLGIIRRGEKMSLKATVLQRPNPQAGQ